MTTPDSTQRCDPPATRNSPFSSQVRTKKEAPPPVLPDPLPTPDAAPVPVEPTVAPPDIELPPAVLPTLQLAPTQTAGKTLSGYIASPMSTEQAAILDDYSARIRIGPAANLPMICMGLECKFYNSCPLVQAKLNLPLGQACPVETSALDMWRQDFIEGYNISKKHPQYALMIRLVDQMVGLEGLENRLMWYAAKDPEILKRETVGFSQQGMAIEAERLNPMLDFILRLKAMKLKMMREMLATPRAEAEARRRLGQDPGSQTAQAAAALSGTKPAFVQVNIGKKP